MKKVLFLTVILIHAVTARSQVKAAGGGARAVAQNSCAVAADAKAIREVAEQWKDGYNKGDVGKVASLYAENAYYLTQHFITGIIHGRAAIQAYVQSGVDAGYHIDSIQIISTGCSGDIAYTVGRYEATNAGEKALGVNVVVLKKIRGRWLIVAHEAAVPDPATAVRHLDIPGNH